MPLFRKVLVANRGEIALRIMRTLRECGILSVAVYSDADALAPHTRYSDESIHIGSNPPAESYLDISKILNAARLTGADAVHPGYGFLSENHHFAQAVADAGLTFIGPTPEAIRLLGSKLEAKQAAARCGVPLVPGTAEPVSDPTAAAAIAGQIGYPLLIKASAGGGGKGMRLVTTPSEFAEQLARAQSEAQTAFGDPSVFLEHYVENPRHIEFQVIGDGHGNIVHLFERECSIQRRHQKLVEEAPSSVLDPDLRREMGEAAVRVARESGYTNAGTVEFIVGQDQRYYFLEINTRLQVEHPVTECITGQDLVRLQLEVAAGNPLPFRQENLAIRGHAIEVRICAENPAENFLPDTGILQSFLPPSGPGVRVDSGYETGMEVPVYYDPLMAKLIVYADTRDAAIERMLRALNEFDVSGVHTTIPFCRFAVDHQAFRSGQFDTGFVSKHFRSAEAEVSDDFIQSGIAALAAATLSAQRSESAVQQQPVSPWRTNRLR